MNNCSVCQHTDLINDMLELPHYGSSMVMWERYASPARTVFPNDSANGNLCGLQPYPTAGLGILHFRDAYADVVKSEPFPHEEWIPSPFLAS